MATCVIVASEFDDDPDRLPAVCALSGAPADRTVRFRLRSTPRWTYVLLLFGILPFLVAQYFAETSIVVRLPIREAALARLQRERKAGGALFLVGAVLVLVGFFAEVGPVLWGGVVVTVVGLAAWAFANARFPGGRQSGPDRVEIWSLHEDFVAALEAAHQGVGGR